MKLKYMLAAGMMAAVDGRQWSRGWYRAVP